MTVAFVWGGDTTTMSISGGGVSWTTAVNGAVVEGGSRLWVFVSAGSPTSGVRTLTFDNDAFVDWVIDNITGTVDLAAPTNANVISGTANSAAPSATLGAFGNALNGVIAYVLATDSLTITEGSGFSMIAASNGGAIFGWSEASQFRDSNDTSVDFSLSAAVPWSIVALEIVDSGASGGTVNTATLSDAVVVTDGTLKSALFSRLVESFLALTDGPTVTSTLHNVIAESSIETSDELLPFLRIHRLLSDAFAVADEASASIIGGNVFLKVLTSELLTTDEVRSSAILTRRLEDFLVTNDAALTSAQRFLMLTDLLSIDDSMLSTTVSDQMATPLIRIGFDQPDIRLGGYRI